MLVLPVTLLSDL